MKRTLYILLLITTTLTSFAQKGRIEGRVFNASNNEPLAFSNILITGTQIGATTDFEGKFIITNIEPGFVTLTVSSLGFETVVSEELVVSSTKPAYIDIPMNETSVTLETVVVKTNKFRKTEESPVSLRTLGPAMIENSPGANRDISKVIQNLPGIAAIPGPNRNDIIVRGGASNESKYYLDEVEIPTINQFSTQGASGGSNGIINADFVREVEFFSGAFPVNRGNALSGVFNFKQINGNKEETRFRGTLGASEISLTADGPLSANTTYIASVRRSYLQFLFKALGLPFLPTFNDYQIKVRTQLDEKSELRIISIGALDQFKLDTDIPNPDENQRYILNFLPIYDQWSYAIGGVYKHFRETGINTLVLSRNMLNNRIYKYLDNDKTDESKKQRDYLSQEIENKLRFESTVRTSNDYKIIYGLSLEQAKYYNSTYQKIYTNTGEDSLEYESDLTFYKYGLFTQVSKKYFNDLATLSFGVRTDAATYSDEMNNPAKQISPRFSLSVVLTDRITFNANTGRYYQLPAYTSLGYRNNEGNLINRDNGIKYVSADHYVAGFEYLRDQKLKLTLEGFYKIYRDYPFSLRDSISLAHKMVDYGTLGDEEVVSLSEGHAYGAELLLQTTLKNDFNLMLSYTFAVSEFRDKNDDFRSTGWDNRHILIATASKIFKKRWYLGMKYRFAGGLPYSPFDMDKSSLISAWNLRGQAYLDYNRLNSERFKPFHQVDFRVDKTWLFNKTSLKLYLDIQNLLNFKSEGYDRITNLDENGNQVMDSEDPSRYVLRTIENEGDGTILPTIGVIFDF